MNDMKRPLLAILTLSSRRMPHGKRVQRSIPFRGRAKWFADLIKEASQRGYRAYVLPWDGTSFTAPLTGYTLSQTHGLTWKRQNFSWPHVVYNRIPDRSAEERSSYRVLLETFREHGSKVFNERFIVKDELYRGLQSGTMKDWLPDTRPYSKQTLADMLSEYRQVFLKPARSSQGKGVCQVNLLQDEICQVKGLLLRPNGNLLRISRLATVNQIDRLFQSFGAAGYVCQQAVKLPVWRRQKFDFRVLVQKNARGRWSLTGWGARRNSVHRVTTHVPRGGKIGDPSRLLRNVFGRSQAEYLERYLRSEIGRLAAAVEVAVGMNMGEMSMDLAVDQNGRCWILEANSKPMKFDEPNIYRKSCRTLIDYSLFLAHS